MFTIVGKEAPDSIVPVVLEATDDRVEEVERGLGISRETRSDGNGSRDIHFTYSDRRENIRGPIALSTGGTVIFLHPKKTTERERVATSSAKCIQRLEVLETYVFLYAPSRQTNLLSSQITEPLEPLCTSAVTNEERL